MPEISVIVPYYNSSLFLLRQCVESILEQTFSDFELLVIIDGSTKNYLPIQQEYEKNDQRIKFFYQKNKGVSAARNLGLEKASGTFLSFVDSDDFVEENFLSKLHKSIAQYDLAICNIADQHYPTASLKMDRRVFCSMPAEFCWVQYTNFSVNKLYRTEIIHNYNIRFDSHVRLGEDAIFLAKYLFYCNNIVSIDDRLYHYVPNIGSATHTYYKDYWDWERCVIEEQWKLFHQYPLSKRETDFLYFWLYRKFCGIFLYYFDKDKKNCLQYITRVIQHPLYQELISQKMYEKEFFRKKNLFALCLWRTFGAKGVQFYYFLKCRY